MSYVGNTALSPQIQERIQNTFEQTLGLAEEGNRQEALLGCDFILRLDPLFEPARRLQERLNDGEGPVSTENLMGGEAPQEESAPQLETEPPLEVAPPVQVEAPVGAAPLAGEIDTPAFEESIPEASVDIGELIADAPDEDPLVGDTPVEVPPVEVSPVEIITEDAPRIATAPVDEMPFEIEPPAVDAINVMEALPEESLIADESLVLEDSFLEEAPVDDEPLIEADLPTRMAMLLEQRNFKDLMSLAMENQDRITGDQDLQQMVGLATERLEAEPYVRNFLDSAQAGKGKGDLEGARSHLEKARELDPSHPDIPGLEADLEAASIVEPPEAFEPSAPVEVPPLEELPPLVEPDTGGGNLEEVDEFFASVEAPAEEIAEPPEEKAPIEEAGDEAPEPQPSNGEPKPVLSLDAEPAARLDSESEQRIDDLLREGQLSFEDGKYQTAIDAWSRIFLIDIDHAEASRRIELARKLKAEVERQTEEAFHEGITFLESGNEEEAKKTFHRVLGMQPSHMGARDYIEKIESGDLTAASASATELPDLKPPEETASEVEAPPTKAPEEADLTPSHTPIPTVGPAILDDMDVDEPEPASGPAPRKHSFVLIGSAVLILVLAVGWFVGSNWNRFFPASGPDDGAATAQTQADPVERARELHEAGNTAMAINVLRRLTPGSDQYAEAQALIANWEVGDQPEDTTSDQPSEEVLAQRVELLTQAEQAISRGENLLAVSLLERAVEIQQLSTEEGELRTRADVALELLREELDLFDQGDWEYALPNLWRMHDANPDNPDVLRLMVDSYYNLGLRDLQRGDAKSALEKFEEAQELAGGDEDLIRLAKFADAYAQRSADMLYRIFVKYQRFR